MKYTKATFNKHTGIHYLVIVREPTDTEELTEHEVQHLVDEASKDLNGAPVEFVGYEVDNEDE